MNYSNKTLKYIKKGLVNPKKKPSVNLWRFFFNAVQPETGAEQGFFIELEMLSPLLSSASPVLGFKPRVAIKEEDLQYALAGTESAKALKTEDILQPSYCCVRVGKAGERGKQLAYYCAYKNLSVNSRDFEISAGDNLFTASKLNGNIALSAADINEHAEYMCEEGKAEWKLTYDAITEANEGYKDNKDHWFPAALIASFAGTISFDDVNYVVDPRRACGYVERYSAKTFPKSWFHLSCASLTSKITGKTLFSSGFAIQGDFDNKLAFLGVFDEIQIEMLADSVKGKNASIWSCSQAPEQDEDGESNLHWSVSLHSKVWVIDIDVYCRIKDLYNRKYEMPEGKRMVMSMLQGGSGTGEIKLYKKNKDILEQIEDAKLEKVVCEFGQLEQAED